MHQFGWLSERGRNFFYWFQKEGGVPKEGGGSPRKEGDPTLEKTMTQTNA